MNFLSIFVLIPLLMLLGLWFSRSIAQIRAVMVTGASALLIAAVGLTVAYLQARHGGATDEMLFRADAAWYPALNIHYSVGVDGISVAMLLLSAIIVFTGTFAPCCQWVYSASSSPPTCSPCSCSMRWPSYRCIC